VIILILDDMNRIRIEDRDRLDNILHSLQTFFEMVNNQTGIAPKNDITDH